MPANLNPNSILNRRVVLATVNNGAVLDEPHKVYGPYGQGIKITKLKEKHKVVIPLTNETGEGAFFLKIHYPRTESPAPSQNRSMYITFCQKDQTYDDGYKDFISKVSQDFIDALKTWIDNGRAESTSGNVRYRKLSFVSHGTDTNQAKNAVSFEVRLNYRGTQITQQSSTPDAAPNNSNVISSNPGTVGFTS